MQRELPRRDGGGAAPQLLDRLGGAALAAAQRALAPLDLALPRARGGTGPRWNAGRGCGFIQPDGGGDNVFCHVSAIADGGALPEGGAVTFEMGLPHPKSRPGTASPGIVGLQGWQEMATVISDWSKCEEIYISEK